jgi:hypothetical protein
LLPSSIGHVSEYEDESAGAAIEIESNDGDAAKILKSRVVVTAVATVPDVEIDTFDAICEVPTAPLAIFVESTAAL